MKTKNESCAVAANYQHKATIKIKECIANDLQFKLDLRASNLKEGIEAVFTAKFEDGMEADIKVCRHDDGFFVDPVMFNSRGGQVCVLDVQSELLGEYYFEANGETYLVEVIVG